MGFFFVVVVVVEWIGGGGGGGGGRELFTIHTMLESVGLGYDILDYITEFFSLRRKMRILYIDKTRISQSFRNA